MPSTRCIVPPKEYVVLLQGVELHACARSKASGQVSAMFSPGTGQTFLYHFELWLCEQRLACETDR